jgi:TolB protein
MMEADGSERAVAEPPIDTLNLGPAAPSRSGDWIAFNGWDETDPWRAGVYLGSPDLADLRLVTPLPDGTVEAEPFGVTPDGAQVLFFADREGTEHHEGDLYIVNADGSGLRQLNPPGTTHSWLNFPGGSLSPDGGQVAFTVADAVFVADVEGGDARRITEGSGFVWAVSWSPTGEWIVFTRQHGTTSVISLVRPDGSDQVEISATDGSDEAAGAVWSPEGDALLVLRRSSEGDDLWIMDLQGNYLGQVTDEPAEYGTYSWAPPGP